MKNHSLAFLKICVFISLFANLPVFAHGESTPGPHGGFVRMPGAFHTEVIPAKNGFNIFLLDIQFQNPVVKNSSVKATLKYADQSIDLKCKAETNKFYCSVNEAFMKKAAMLDVTAVRDNAKGMMTHYPLPLKLES